MTFLRAGVLRVDERGLSRKKDDGELDVFKGGEMTEEAGVARQEECKGCSERQMGGPSAVESSGRGCWWWLEWRVQRERGGK